MQQRHNIWHFGENAGIDFNTTPPTAIPGPIVTDEGVATICDSSGQLLFSTNGVDVYDKSNQVMFDGSGLLGNISTTQSVVIVPDPGDDSSYYLFTAPDVSTGGLHYSIVDLRLNGGLGAVTVKNVPLVTPIAEKLTCINHGNGVDYWILCHKQGTDEFYAYLLTSLGVTGSIISKTGIPYIPDHNGFAWSGLGDMKPSPNGKKIACAYSFGDSISDNTFVEVFDFDPCSGQVRYAFTIDTPTNAYGLSFSPNGNLLYVTMDCTLNDTCVMQYQLSGNSVVQGTCLMSALAESMLNPGFNPIIGTLQIAPNGQLYFSVFWDTFLRSIPFPDVAGPGCGYIREAINLTGSCGYGLPPAVSKRKPALIDADSLVVCEMDSVHLGINPVCWSSVLWSTGSHADSIWGKAAGTYWVEVSNGLTVFRDTVVLISHTSQVTRNRQSLPITCQDSTISLMLPPGRLSYAWTGGKTGNILPVFLPGVYTCISYSEACVIYRDTFEVIGTNLAAYTPLPDTVVCDFPVTLTATGLRNPHWNTGNTSPVLQVWDAGVFLVKGADSCGFVPRMDTVIVRRRIPPPAPYLGPDSALCTFPLLLEAVAGWNTYTWNTGATTRSLQATQPGTYQVTVEGDCPAFTRSDAITLTQRIPMITDLWPSQGVLCNQSVALSIPPYFIAFEWEDSYPAPERLVSTPGVYIAQAYDGCSWLRDTIWVRSAYQPQIVLPAEACEDVPFSIQTAPLPSTPVRIFWNAPSGQIANATAAQTTATFSAPGPYRVEVATSDSGCLMQSHADIQVNAQAEILPLDQMACSGDTLWLAYVATNPRGYSVTVNAGSAVPLQVPDMPEKGATLIGLTTAQVGSYPTTIEVQVPACPAVSVDRPATILPYPVAAFTPDSGTFFAGQSVALRNLSRFASTYRWENWDADAEKYLHNIDTQGDDAVVLLPHAGPFTVSLIATSVAGCSDTVRGIFRAENVFLTFPSAFTPNGDEDNRFFQAFYRGLASLHVQVFDRWGKVLYETTDPAFAWDGTVEGVPVPEGAYVWLARAVMENGKPIEQKGNILIIR